MTVVSQVTPNSFKEFDAALKFDEKEILI